MISFINKRNIKSMLRKEFRQLFRDPKMRAVMFIPPIMMVLVFGYAVNTDVNEARLAVIDGDGTVLSREFISRFTGSPYFKYYAHVYNPAEAVKFLETGEIDFYIKVNRGFSKDIKSGKKTGVQIIIDGSDSTRASVISAYINIVTTGFMREHLRDRIQFEILSRSAAGRLMPGSIEFEQRIFFNQDLKSINFFLPGVIGLLIALITIMLTAMSIVKERETGTIEQINVSPLHPFEYIMGKMIPFAIIAFADIFIITIIALFWFNVPFRGSFLFLLLCGIFFIVSSLSVGLYISTISQTQQQAMLSSFLFFLPAILFSGFVFPIYSMPPSIQLITFLNPLRYFIAIVRGIFLKGTGPAVLWPEILPMIALGTGLLFLSVKRYRKRST